MKNKVFGRRTAAIAAAAVMSVSCMASMINSPVYMPVSTVTASAADSVSILNSVGFAEGMYATWSAVSGATGYNVYVDGVQIDSMLIRQYQGYMRADALGLTAGSHTMRIVPIVNGSEDASKASETTADAYAHDRSGFGFVNGTSSGAYNEDGTLKSDAVVIYVTEENKDSVKATVPNKDGNLTEVTGIQEIITTLKGSKSTTPVDIRFIGNITDPAGMAKGDLMLDTAKNGVTIEGVGNDATLNGFGLVMKNCSNVEVRNLGFMNCNSSEGDNCGLQQGNDHIWVHNCDFFYGDAGSDADQVKGDGALDTKTSSYVTHSYNHFWDNGKCNLQGMKSEKEENYVTYHHNWYDHSDSRHPRIRTCTVHSYNNYFDGNAKYGVGVTMGASCFVENNYFRNCKYPMLISMQGSDLIGGGTFSGENGGVIKAYNNYIEGAKAFVPYSENNTDFDAYVVSDRNETVPSSVTSKAGGTAYNNFDTASGMYEYTADSPEDAKENVIAKAGRVDGGDLKWPFDNSVDDESYAVNQALKDALVAYDDTIVAIGSGFKEDNSNPPEQTTASTASKPQQDTTTTTAKPSTPVVSGGQVHDFTANGKDSSFYTITGNLSTSKGTVTYDGKTLKQCLKMESATSITFNAGSAGKLTLVFAEAGKSVKVDGKKYTTDANGVATVDLEAGSHTITKGDSISLFYMVLSGESGGSTQTTAPTNTNTPGQSTTTTVTVVPPVTPSGDIKVVYAGGWNEMAYLVCSGLTDANVTGVSYTGASNGSLKGEDFEYLVRDVEAGVRVDLLGLKPGTYSITLDTTKGKVTQSGIVVGQQDRSGYAHFNYDEGVGAYTDGGELKVNAKVIYVTEENKNTVTVTSKDGTTVKGIGNILNSVGQDVGGGKTANGGTKANTNAGIIKKLAEDGTPLVIRIVGDVTAPEGLTAYDSTDFGGSVGDNGFMARMKSGKNITIEGVGNDATVNGWGFHFMAESSAPELGKSFEVRNIAFRNVPEDCIGFEGVQEGSNLTATIERCWVHNCEFYVPHISNPAESDKAEGDGACDFKRGQYFTNSYCYYEGYHKTNLVGSSDDSLQYHLTYHHNYWKNCESRGPLARQADIHMYNNVFDGQSSYCASVRANSYIFSEYNAYVNECKDPVLLKSGGVFKSYNDARISLKKGAKYEGTDVTSRTEKVSNNNKFSDFDTNSSVSYIPSGSYSIVEKTGQELYDTLNAQFETDGGCMDNMKISSGGITIDPPTPSDKKYGDANKDGDISIADAVLIMQAMVNGDEYKLSPEQADLADVYHRGDGVTAADALSIQKYIANLITSLPEVE